MTALYQRWVVGYVFDLGNLTACEWYECEAASGVEAVAVTGVQLGLAISGAGAIFRSATLEDIESGGPLGPGVFRIREIKPYCFGVQGSP